MTSPSFDSVAADANVLLSAAIGRAARLILVETKLQVLTTDSVLVDVRKYLGGLADRYALSRERAFVRLAAFPVLAVSEAEYQSHIEEAERLMAPRDSDDAPLLALALSRNAPIWSNDRDFEGLSHPVYTTAQLLTLCGFEKRR